MPIVVLEGIDLIRSKNGTEVDLDNIVASTDLGIEKDLTGGNVTYKMGQPSPPPSISQFDTSSLSGGETLIWNASTSKWEATAFTIENY